MEKKIKREGMVHRLKDNQISVGEEDWYMRVGRQKTARAWVLVSHCNDLHLLGMACEPQT